MRGETVERLAVIVELSRPFGGVLTQRHTLSLRVANGLIIHIREVTHMLGTQTAQLHHTAEHVLHHEGAEIADVCRSIHSRTATVEAQLLAVFRLHGLQRPRLSII